MATIGRQIQLLRGLATTEIAYTPPFYVVMDLTRRCNLNCLGCRFHGQEARIESPGDQTVKDIPFELAKRVIEELSEMGTGELVFLGEGEPFLYRHLFELIALGKAAGLQIETVTNGLPYVWQACTLTEKTEVHGERQFCVGCLQSAECAGNAQGLPRCR